MSTRNGAALRLQQARLRSYLPPDRAGRILHALHPLSGPPRQFPLPLRLLLSPPFGERSGSFGAALTLPGLRSAAQRPPLTWSGRDLRSQRRHWLGSEWEPVRSAGRRGKRGEARARKRAAGLPSLCPAQNFPRTCGQPWEERAAREKLQLVERAAGGEGDFARAGKRQKRQDGKAAARRPTARRRVEAGRGSGSAGGEAKPPRAWLRKG